MLKYEYANFTNNSIIFIPFFSKQLTSLVIRRIDVLSKRLGKLESCVNKLSSFLKKGLTLFTASKALSIDLMTEQFM
jgi:hypothetical protein